jgi:L-ribulose-5-phosphate 3-epimerase
MREEYEKGVFFMSRIIAVNTNTYHGFHVDDALEGIAAAGFKYVEIAAVRNWTEHIMPEWPREQIEHVKAKLSELGLECIAMSGHCDLSDPERLNDFRANMALAHELGCQWIISSTGEAHFMSGEEGTEDLLIENLKALVPDLKKFGLKLGIETHGPNYGTGEAIARLVRGAGSDLIGVNFDTANVVFWGKSDPSEDLLKCLDEINFCHLKDKIGMDSTWNFPAIGAGELPLVEIMATMEKSGKKVPYSIEIEYTEEFDMRDKTPEDLPIVNKAVQDSYDYLASKGLI